MLKGVFKFPIPVGRYTVDQVAVDMVTVACLEDSPEGD